MSETRSGQMVSAQIAKMGVIDATKSNFALDGGVAFNIKNDASAPVSMDIRLAGMPKGEFITTTIEMGWNPEIVVEVKATSAPHNLKWGY